MGNLGLLEKRPLAKMQSFGKGKSWVKLPMPFAGKREKLRD
jgi:hypothetical protein